MKHICLNRRPGHKALAVCRSMAPMIEFMPLEQFDAEALAILPAGYISTSQYVVSQTETPELTTLRLELTPLARPCIK